MVGLAPDSGPYVKLSAEMRQVAKLIAALEKERAGEETEDERERRRRREDGETVKALTQYADQAIAFSLKPSADAPHGRCPTCSVPLTAEGRVMLLA
jgi:DNA repair exonuclease SbcCD ATPase subunit